MIGETFEERERRHIRDSGLEAAAQETARNLVRAIGAQALGYVQLRDGEWERRTAERVAGLAVRDPAVTIIARARQALETRAAARTARNEAVQQAKAWIAEYQPADGRTSEPLREAWVKAERAYTVAGEALPDALYALGELVTRANELRTSINNGPRLIEAEEQQSAQRVALIRAGIERDRLEAQRLGLTE